MTASEQHRPARQHAQGGRVAVEPRADEYVDLWLRTAFRGGVHQRRIDMIAALERGESLL